MINGMATTTNFASGQEWTGGDPFGGTTAADRARNFARARRHTRFVRALRFTLPLGTAGVVALYFVMIMDTTGWTGGFPKLELPRIIPDNLTMDNPSYEGFNKDGGKYVVRAKTAIQDLVNTEFVRLNDITGDMTDAKKSKTNLTAAKGEFNTKTNQLELTGGIDIVAESGLKAKLSSATILTNDNIISSKEPVLVEMPSGTVRSNEMRILSKSREIAFVHDVKAHLVPEKPDAAEAVAADGAKKPATPMFGGGEGPIDITANRLDVDDIDKTAIFTGNVKARQGDAAMETAALEVQYEGGDTGDAGSAPVAAAPGAGTKIKRIFSKSAVVMTRAPQDRVTGSSFDYDAVGQVAVIDGNVQMTSGADRTATSAKATVDQKADTILLTGDVVAIQGRNQLKGERLFVERATGRTQLSSPGAAGEDPGRISTRFYRGEQSAQTAKDKVKQLASDAAAAAQGAAVVFKTDPTAPIDVEAGRLDVDDRSKQAVFKSDVRAVQGDFVVRTSELRAYYNGAAGLAEESTPGEKKPPAEITRIEARGAVIVTSKNGQKATGDWADFNVKENKVVLSGDVVLTQEKNVVRGSKLTIDMVTGESVIHTDPGAAWSATAAPAGKEGPGFTAQPGAAKRPSAIFYPRDKKAAEKKPSGGASGASNAPATPDGWSASEPGR
jgi:lipopolysaccharide transport protein LptA/LPS export ABC transporter protein LptC